MFAPVEVLIEEYITQHPIQLPSVPEFHTAAEPHLLGAFLRAHFPRATTQHGLPERFWARALSKLLALHATLLQDSLPEAVPGRP